MLRLSNKYICPTRAESPPSNIGRSLQCRGRPAVPRLQRICWRFICFTPPSLPFESLNNPLNNSNYDLCSLIVVFAASLTSRWEPATNLKRLFIVYSLTLVFLVAKWLLRITYLSHIIISTTQRKTYKYFYNSKNQ